MLLGPPTSDPPHWIIFLFFSDPCQDRSLERPILAKNAKAKAHRLQKAQLFDVPYFNGELVHIWFHLLPACGVL